MIIIFKKKMILKLSVTMKEYNQNLYEIKIHNVLKIKELKNILLINMIE
tara:strand:+ start:78 stop:224 length:147 start_codon:yes stop_codon:yes gene_type:complete